MATKESYPIYSMICYTVVAVGLYSIYANYTDRNPDAPKSKQVVQVKNDIPKQSATPIQVKPELTSIKEEFPLAHSSDKFRVINGVTINCSALDRARAQGYTNFPTTRQCLTAY